MKNTLAIIRTAVLTAAALVLCRPSLLAADGNDAKSLIPKIFGVLKPRFENNSHTGDVRFNINNARLGVKGNATAGPGVFSYLLQAEMNAEGKFSILDTYVSFTIGGFDVSLGQQLSRFCTEINRGPGRNYFASSSFMTSYVGSYYSFSTPGNTLQGSTGNFGARDIGITLHYGGTEKFPVNLQAGLMNGNGINNPRWSKSLNFVTRVWIEPERLHGFGLSANCYTGHTPTGNPITMAGGELRYIKGRWTLEGEYASRWLSLPSSGATDRLDLAVAHAIYRQPVRNWGVVKFIAPMVRWDYANNLTMADTKSALYHFDAQRITGGLTVGFAEKLLKCELRFNYEHYMMGRNPLPQVVSNPVFQDKLIVEFFLAF